MSKKPFIKSRLLWLTALLVAVVSVVLLIVALATNVLDNQGLFATTADLGAGQTESAEATDGLNGDTETGAGAGVEANGGVADADDAASVEAGANAGAGGSAGGNTAAGADGAAGSSSATPGSNNGNQGSAAPGTDPGANPTRGGEGAGGSQDGSANEDAGGSNSSATDKPASPANPKPPVSEQANEQITVTLSVDGSAASKLGYSASMGNKTLNLAVGSTVYDALLASGLAVSAGGGYVRSIAGLSEFDGGPGSGWLYFVNGTSPSMACTNYVLQGGEDVRWVYTLGD